MWAMLSIGMSFTYKKKSDMKNKTRVLGSRLAYDLNQQKIKRAAAAEGSASHSVHRGLSPILMRL